MSLISLLANADSDIESKIISFSLKTVLFSSLILIVLMLISTKVVKNKKLFKFKKPIFILIILTIAIPSLLMTGSTVYLNTISDSKGPVHWHTDIEFWVCGQEIELRDPYAFLSNKVGTSSYHEHDDKRIHLEGVVIDKESDASLDKFMDVTGGSIDDNELVIPTEESIFEDDIDGDKIPQNQESIINLVKSFSSKDSDGRTILTLNNGKGCSEQGYAEIQAFLYRYNKEDDTYTQTKLTNPASYTMRDESTVPPGDCLIVEFDMVKSKTDKLCMQYGVRDSVRCVEFGVSAYNPDLCNIKEIQSSEFDDFVNKVIQTEEQ
ncbi:hypothetical protein KBB49_04405 [Candidatus Saccharibacteria bacterium]|nr:hypothetical protein [Candidatus Saccharibacteria bacterium]